MLDFELLRDKGILIVTPDGPLEKAGFERVAKEVDPYLAKDGMLRGMILYAQAFPGWDSFAALSAHFKFMRDHQRKIERLAVVTDSDLLKKMPHIALLSPRDETVSIWGKGGRSLAWLGTVP